jgi:hypothetical protein
MKKWLGLLIGLIGMIIFQLAAYYKMPFGVAFLGWSVLMIGFVLHVRLMKGLSHRADKE